MATVIKLVQGDTRPALIVTLRDTDDSGDPINISGATVRLLFREYDALALTDSIVGSIIDPLNGLVKFNWNTDTLDIPGDYEGEFEVTYSDGTIHTTFDKVYFYIREQHG